jgi:hypothetical protein
MPQALVCFFSFFTISHSFFFFLRWSTDLSVSCRTSCLLCHQLEQMERNTFARMGLTYAAYLCWLSRYPPQGNCASFCNLAVLPGRSFKSSVPRYVFRSAGPPAPPPDLILHSTAKSDNINTNKNNTLQFLWTLQFTKYCYSYHLL